MKIGITDNMGSETKWQLYVDWLKKGEPEVEIVKLSYVENNLAEIEQCDGILLTGGGDVHPGLYGVTSVHPKVYGIDTQRDDFERQVVDLTMKLEKPMLGICRGLQITNVHFGGTLVLDLEELGHRNHSTKETYAREHEVLIEPGTVFSSIVGVREGTINSYHHQAALKPGIGLKVTARSADGVIEGLELADASEQPFFQLVQWHPERMNDETNPLSQNILQHFFEAIKQTTDILS